MITCTDLEKNNYDEIIVFQSDFKNITYAEQVIQKMSSKIVISDEIYGNVLLSLSEAINNAIVHGNKFNPNKNVTVYYKISSKKLEIAVKDEGAGFDYKLIDDPTETINREKLTGRGVFIILNLADIVEFSYNNGQIVKMIFNL